MKSLKEDFYDIIQSTGSDKKQWVDLEKPNVKKKILKDLPTRENLFDLVDFAYRTALKEPHVGVKSYNDVLGDDYDYWEAIDIDDNPKAEAVLFGKKKHGIKISGLGHNGASLSKQYLMIKLEEVLNKKGYWIECSLGVAKALKRFDIPRVEKREIIEKLFPDSKIVEWFEDNSYIRSSNERVTGREYVFGSPKI